MSSRFSNITDFQKNKTYKYTKYTLRNVFLILLSLLYCYSQKLLVLGSPSKGRPWLLLHSLFTDVHFTVISSVNTGIKTQRLEQVVECSKMFLVWMTLSVVLTWRKSPANVCFDCIELWKYLLIA